MLLGTTNAPSAIGAPPRPVLAISEPSLALRPVPRITLAKCVGTDTLGGEPITSYDTRHLPSDVWRGRYSGMVNT